MANILFLYNLTDTGPEPWLAAGHHVTSVDLQHPAANFYEGQHLRFSADVLNWVERLKQNRDMYDFVISFTPCTETAVSGARWFKKKREANPRFQEEAVELARVVEKFDCPSITENPVSVLWTMWQPCTGYVDPHWFTNLCPEDNYTKKTGLLCLNGACMPQKNKDESLGEPDDRIHKAAPGPDRQNFRSATPRGMAQAIYLANRHLVE